MFGGYVFVPDLEDVVNVPSPKSILNPVKFPSMLISYSATVPSQLLLSSSLISKEKTASGQASSIQSGSASKERILQSKLSFILANSSASVMSHIAPTNCSIFIIASAN